MTTWQTDVCDTQELTREALKKLFKTYDRPVMMEADGLLAWFEPVGVDCTDTHDLLVDAPTESDVWQDLVRLTTSLARMGYFTTRGFMNVDGGKWNIDCRRGGVTPVPPTQSIWPWAE